MSRRFHITERDGDRWAIKFDYSQAAVDTVKTTVSSTFRTWNEHDRTWLIVGRRNVTDLAAALGRIGYVGDVPEPPQPKVTRVPIGQHLAAVMQRIGPAYRHKVLRTLAAGAHPDVGGDGELSREVNRMRDETQ